MSVTGEGYAYFIENNNKKIEALNIISPNILIL